MRIVAPTQIDPFVPVAALPVAIPAGEDATIVATADVDLTGWTATLTIKRAVTDASAVLRRAATISGAQATLALARTETLALRGQYVWDLSLVDPAGNGYQAVRWSRFEILLALGQPGQGGTTPPPQSPP